jgi:hypothetical protein
MIATGGGRFDPAESFVFFVAMSDTDVAVHPWTLVALNDILNDAGVGELQRRLDSPGSRTMLDSGVFWLASTYAKNNDMSLAQALTVDPESMPGFDRLVSAYVDIVRTAEPKLWGYVELDQGGADTKRRLRAMLEAEGLRPIPVYHPLSDPYDYFDELLESYDRVCIGNLAMAAPDARRAILGDVWERRRRHVGPVWLHALGVTPAPILNAYPINSADSSTHVYAIKRGASQCMGRAMLARCGALEYGYWHPPDATKDPEIGRERVVKFMSWVARTDVEAWRAQWADSERVFPGMSPWPATGAVGDAA